MAQAAWPVVERRFGQTRRRDAWWVQPFVTFLGLSAFVVYATWAAFQGNHYEFGPYLSPSTLRSSLAKGRTRGSGLSRAGGQARCRFLPRC